MKLLLDAHLSHEIAELLARRGFDVVAVTARGDLPDNASDRRLMDIARAEDRAIVTNNVKDFRPIAAERISMGLGHAGLVLIPSRAPRTKAATGPLADALEALMRESPEGLADRERWI